MPTAKMPGITPREYEQAAQAYLRRLPPEHFMETAAQGRQRAITLASLALVHARRPAVQVFNELLVQYPRPRGEPLGQPGPQAPRRKVIMIEALAFDFGRVLGHFDHGRTLGKLTPFTDMSESDMYGLIYDGDLEDAFESGQVGEAEFLRQFRTLCGLRCDDAYLAAAVADIFWPNEALCNLIAGLKPRYRLVLGSNTNPIHARRFVPQFADVLRHFDALVLSHEVRARKPGAAFYGHLIQAAGTEPQRVVFIDDLADNIAGARACGLQGMVFQDIDQLRGDLRRLGVTL